MQLQDKSDTRSGGRAKSIFGAIVAVSLVAGLLWLGGEPMIHAIRQSDPLPQIAAVALGILSYVAAADRWCRVTNALTSREVAPWADFLKVRVLTGAIGFFIPRELAETGGRALWLTKSRDVSIPQAARSLVLDRLGDIVVTALGILPSTLFFFGVVTAEQAVLATATLFLAGFVFASPLIAAVGRLARRFHGLTTRLPLIGPKLTKLEDVVAFDPALMRPIIATSVLKNVMLIARALLISSAVGLSVQSLDPTIVALYPLSQVAYGISFTPGSVGIFEAGWFGLLHDYAPAATIVAFLVLLRINMMLSIGCLVIYCHIAGISRKK